MLPLHLAPNIVWSCILNHYNIIKHVKVKNAFIVSELIATENNNNNAAENSTVLIM